MRRQGRGARLTVTLLLAVLGAAAANGKVWANEDRENAERAETGARQADSEMSGNPTTIRKANDDYLKAREPLYSRQAKSLAQQYRETAEMVARQGGDARPILDAAAYFEKEAEPESRKPSKESVSARQVVE